MDTTNFAVECRHCGNKGLMCILLQESLVQDFEHEGDSMAPIQWEAGNIYQILRCYACSEITVYQQSVHTGTDPAYVDRSYDQILYPCHGESPTGLPAGIQREWDAAMRVRRINQNSFAVLLGRVLDAICIDQKAEGNFLNDRIDHLATSGKLPLSLKDVAHGLRKLRNFGAHGNVGDLDVKDTPLLESLCRALLVYFYTVPALMQEVERRLT